jgi:hypothetical protein
MGGTLRMSDSVLFSIQNPRAQFGFKVLFKEFHPTYILPPKHDKTIPWGL